jgi:Flp pilus assembly protein TadD
VTEFYRMVDQAFKLAQAQRIPEAIEMLRDALGRVPDDAMAHYNLGTLLSDSGQQSEALEEYRKASELSPENTTFLERLGLLQVLSGDADGGIDKLRKAIDMQPTLAEYRFNLGYVLESRGDFAGAVVPLESAVELSQGKNARILAELAKACDKTGRFPEAIQSAQRGLDAAIEGHDEQQASSLRDAMALPKREDWGSAAIDSSAPKATNRSAPLARM